MNEQKQKILEFLKTQILGIVSTIDYREARPESAVVAFSETEELEIIFGTFNDTRKFRNLEHNPAVAFVIGWESVTVQYEGIAKISSGKEVDECRNILLQKNPKSNKFAFDERQRFIKVSPRWIRYSDFSVNPENVFEVSF